MASNYNITDIDDEFVDNFNHSDDEHDFVQDDSESYDYDPQEAQLKWGALDFGELVTEVINQLESGKKKGFSKSKKVVDAEQISSLSKYILQRLPIELDKAREIIAQEQAIINRAQLEADEKQEIADRYIQAANKSISEKKAEAVEIENKANATKDAIIADAGKAAEQIIVDAQEEAERRVEINAITVQAKERATEILQLAEETANTMKFQASKEASDLLTKTKSDCDNQRATAANAMRHANMVLSQSLDEFVTFSLNKAETVRRFSRDIGTVMTNLADNTDANVNYIEE
ncbi:MAG: hypothetical protein R3Y27_06240 [Clostridia bacterium]